MHKPLFLVLNAMDRHPVGQFVALDANVAIHTQHLDRSPELGVESEHRLDQIQVLDLPARFAPTLLLPVHGPLCDALVDASVMIPAWDRHGVERLVRYCARPALSQECLGWVSDEMLVYSLKKPTVDGRTEIYLTPLELNRFAIPPKACDGAGGGAAQTRHRHGIPQDRGPLLGHVAGPDL